jgi:hypothetical protein
MVYYRSRKEDRNLLRLLANDRGGSLSVFGSGKITDKSIINWHHVIVDDIKATG